jgi:hypothetical protein
VIVKNNAIGSIFSQNIKSIVRVQVVLVIVIFLTLLVLTSFIIINPPSLQSLMVVSVFSIPFFTSLFVLITCFWKGAVQREVITMKDVNYYLLISFYLSLHVVLGVALVVASLFNVYTVILMVLSIYSYNLWLKSFIK